METKKVLSLIFSILFIGAFAFVLSWGIINFNKVQDGISGTGVYTKEDVDNAYKDGYSTALDNEKEYTQLIDSYRDTITTQTDELSKLNNQLLTLTNSNKDYTNQIANLTEQKNSLEEQVNNLSLIKNSNESTINDLTSQILILEKEVSDLQNSDYNKSQEIAQKNSQISNLQNSVNQLQKTNELNVQTINSLNNQITTLNSQISEMTLQIQNNSTNVTTLNNKIAELEKSVAYYEQYLASLENGEQVVATFEFNGSVYNIQIVSANSTLSVTTPNSTDYIVFNYWTVNGEQIDLSTYTINQNTKIVADVTYNYDVKFMVDDSVYNNQIITKNGFATLPINPTKSGYEFDGWTINGVDIIDPTSVEIIDKTTFVAKFTKLHNVNFVYEDSTISTQSIRNGNFANNVSVDNTTYKKFNGWTINGTIVDLDSYKIVAETTFIADIIYSYDVTFIVDDEVYNSQIVQNNNYVVLPTEMPQKNRYEFVGWSLDGVNVVDVENMQITNNMSFICVWKEKIGFDNEVFGVSLSSLNSNAGIYQNENYFVSLDSQCDNVLLINKTTGDKETFKCTNSTLLNHDCSLSSCYLYKNNFYFTCGATGSSTKRICKLDLETKIVSDVVKSTNTSYATINYYKNKMIVYTHNSSTDYSKPAYYSIFDLDTIGVVDNSYYSQVKVSETFTGRYSGSLVDGYFVSLGKDTSLSYSSYKPNCMVVIDIMSGTHKVVQLESSSSYKPSLYYNGENLYISYKNKYAIYDFDTNTIGEYSSIKPTYYHYVSDTHKFVIDTANKQLKIVDNNGNEVSVDYPSYPYGFEKISDTQYLVYLSSGCCYLWL